MKQWSNETLKQLNNKTMKLLKHKLLFIVIFAILGVILLQLPLTQLVGSKARFTLFDVFAPTVGAFIGVLPGVAAVLIVQAINTFFQGGFADLGAVIRLFPTLFSIWYFARKDKGLLFIPLLAMLAFNLHPVGSQVWYFSLFWTIPLAAHFLRRRFLIARSLGATFTAHAVGSAAWIWAIDMPASIWQGLIPLVILERTVFAIGISVTYVVVTNVLAYFLDKKILSLPFSLEKRYVFLNKSYF